MSGICGFYYNRSRAPVNREHLWDLNNALHDRGPDSGGYYLDGNAGLAIRRLNAVDALAGEQPIQSEDEQIVLTCSGEIYNAFELRRTLESVGHSFRSNSDLECIVHGYEEWGDEVVDRLNGQFCFALWDERRRRLMLGRDCMGQRPMYWHYSTQGLVWSTELKPILRVPWVNAQVSPLALHHYLSLKYVPDPLTIIEGVHKLPPAHILVLEEQQEPKILRWWKVRFAPKVFGKANDHFREATVTFDSVVKRHLLSDSPMGVLLNGNVESSLLAAVAAQHSSQPLQTFSLTFPTHYSNDASWARRVSRYIASEHHEFPFVTDDLAGLVQRSIDVLPDPIGDSSIIPLYELTRQARQHVRLLLTSDGALETMAGTSRYTADILANIFSFFPRVVTHHLFPTMAALLPHAAWLPSERNPLLGAKRIAQALDLGPKASFLRWDDYFSHGQKLELYRPELADAFANVASTDLLQRVFDSADADRYLDQTLYTAQRSYLSGSILPQTESAAMAHALLSRSPFVDKQWVEWTARLPAECKQTLFHRKVLLRKAFQKKLPTALGNVNLEGLNVPMNHWLRRELRSWVQDQILGTHRLETWFRRPALERIVSDHIRGRRDNGEKVWLLAVLNRWLATAGI